MAKKKGIDMGDPGYNQKDWEAHRWCIRNNIFISPKAKSSNEWYIDITNKGITNTTPVTYGKNDIWIKIFEYCKYYYEKHKHRK
tara:strand:- start:328 stop:579 length:252 start_codon:yes stop_codon:yes gene_type:complete